MAKFFLGEIVGEAKILIKGRTCDWCRYMREAPLRCGIKADVTCVEYSKVNTVRLNDLSESLTRDLLFSS